MKTIRDYILEHGLDTIDFDSHYSKKLPKSCNEMFKYKNIDVDKVESFDTSEVEYMNGMFSNCEEIKSLDLSGWDTSKVKEAFGIFENCKILEWLDLSGWDTSNVKNMSDMFYNCINLKSLDLSGWDTSNVKYTSTMFEHCENLESLDLSGWDTSNMRDMYNIFARCDSLTDIKFGPGWGKQNYNTLSLIWCGRKKGHKLSDETWNSMLTMYDRNKAGLEPIEIVLDEQHNIPDGWKQQIEAKGYEILIK